MRFRGAAALIAAACASWASQASAAALPPSILTGGPDPSLAFYMSSSGYIEMDGTPVVLGLDLTDTPPTELEADIVPGYVIAHHSLRVREARVLLEPVHARRDLPAGTVLSKVTYPDRKGFTAWCDLTGRFNAFRVDNAHVCLSETDGSGKFTQAHLAESSTDFLGYLPAAVRDGAPLDHPAAYREARPEERTTALLGYQWCDGDGDQGPPRFALVATVPGQAWSAGLPYACAFGVWPDPTDHSRVDLDGVTLTVHPGPRPNTLHVKFNGRIPPIENVARLEPGQPIRAVGQGPTPWERHNADMRLQSLIPVGAEPTVAEGLVSYGQTFLSAKVQHGITGVLRNQVRSGSRTLPVGQPVFGIIAASFDGGQIVWCAPLPDSADPSGEPQRAATVCLPNDGYHHEWVEVGTYDYPPQDLGLGRWASTPTVDRRPVDLSLLTLSLVYEGPGEKSGTVAIRTQLDGPHGRRVLKRVDVEINAASAAIVHELGETIEVTPNPDDSSHAFVRLLRGDGCEPEAPPLTPSPRCR